MKVVLSKESKADLLEIKEFIKTNSPKRAQAFTEKLLDRCAALVDMPYAFPIIPRYEQHQIRRVVHENYLIFYRVKNQRIEVIRILHGARDFDALLFPNPEYEKNKWAKKNGKPISLKALPFFYLSPHLKTMAAAQ